MRIVASGDPAGLRDGQNCERRLARLRIGNPLRRLVRVERGRRRIQLARRDRLDVGLARRQRGRSERIAEQKGREQGARAEHAQAHEARSVLAASGMIGFLSLLSASRIAHGSADIDMPCLHVLAPLARPERRELCRLPVGCASRPRDHAPGRNGAAGQSACPSARPAPMPNLTMVATSEPHFMSG